MAHLEIVLATANPHKVSEIEEILRQHAEIDVDLIPRPIEIPEVEETGVTLVENARLKATAVVRATNTMSVADDTGLFVLALGGAPGVHSARYAGVGATDTENVAKLLVAMSGVTDRRAVFETVALAMLPDGTEFLATGQLKGTITTTARGGSGFGYDPVFVPDEMPGCTLAELTSDEKHRLSHRGRAFRALGAIIADAHLAQ